MVLLWVGGGLAALGVAAVVGRRTVERRAADALDEGLRDVERRVTAALGGTARIEVEGEPLPVLLGLRQHRLPAARLTVERATLPNGLDVSRLELTARRDADHAELVAHVTPRAVSRQLGIPGLAVTITRGRLRLIVGLASVAVDVTVRDQRVVLNIPVAPPPIGTVLSAGLTELVPRAPDGVELQDVRVRADELEIVAVVGLDRLLELADLDD